MALQVQSPRYLLDTNIISELVEGNVTVLANYRRVYQKSVLIPIVAYAESVGGWISKINGEKNKARVPVHYDGLHRSLQVINRHQVLPFSDEAMQELSKLPRGKPPIGEGDRRIAACAIATGYILVTGDRHFDQLLPQEQIVDWTVPLNLNQ